MSTYFTLNLPAEQMNGGHSPFLLDIFPGTLSSSGELCLENNRFMTMFYPDPIFRWNPMGMMVFYPSTFPLPINIFSKVAFIP
jgi:hypothetical protein